MFEGRDALLDAVTSLFTLERGLLVGGLFLAAGLDCLVAVYAQWVASDFGALNAIRPALFGMALMTIGGQTIFSSFLLSVFNFRKAR